MYGKILVGYATRCGSTAGVAQAVGEVLSAHGIAVDVRPIQEVTGIDAYQAVILGSAIRYSQFLPEAVRFLEHNRAALDAKPLALFACHIQNLGSDDTSRKQRAVYLDAPRKLVTPKAEAFFAGVGDLSKVSLFERLLGRATRSPEGDFRDWTAIRGWAESLYQNGFEA